MEISHVMLLLIATGCAIVSAVIVSMCLTCCYCLRGRKRNKKIQGDRERKLYDVGNPCLLKMERCQPLAVDKENDKQKSVASNGDSHFIFDERTVAEKAKNEDNTLVWTNKGQVIMGSNSTTDHAIEVFTTTDTQPDQITELYIKESPCYTCVCKLIQHFKHCHKKPTLFLGKIRHLHNVSDREGLRQLIQEGFDIALWTHLHYLMLGDDTTSINYITELKNETTMYCYFGIYN